MKKQKLSIIEILIVVALLTILASIGVAHMSKIRYKAQKVDMTIKVAAIDMAMKQYYRDFGEWPKPSNENSSDNRADQRRPFSEIEAVLLGDNSKGISYLKSSPVSVWMSSSDSGKNTLGNGNNAYEGYEFMVALDYDGDGFISKNVFQNKTDPAITEDLATSSGAAIWLHTPEDWDTDISNWAESTLKSTDDSKGNGKK